MEQAAVDQRVELPSQLAQLQGVPDQEMGLDLPEGDYETVAGFVLKLLGHIPHEGEQLKYKNLKLVVTAMQGLKVEKILITKEKHAETTG